MADATTAPVCGPGIGFCAPSEAPSEPLTARQRAGRAGAGGVLVAVAAGALHSPNMARLMAAGAFGWLGVSHLVAAVTRYSGCPELGAIPSLVLGRQVHTRCGPWESLDARLGLNEPAKETTGA